MINLKRLKMFFSFCNERHAIYMRRQRGDKWPWTEDPILQQYKFTNIYRELDTGTKWLRENIREPYADDPELFFNIAMYRRYNRIECAKHIGYVHKYLAAKYEMQVEAYKRLGGKVFTAAYMTCAGIRDANGTLSKSKVHQIFFIGFGDLWRRRKEVEPQLGDTLELAHNRLVAAKIPSFGPFIVYEVISDLRWTRYLKNATDIMTWANPGPGAVRGVGRILGYDVREVEGGNHAEFIKQRKEYSDVKLQLEVMRELLHYSSRYLKDYMPYMELRDIEHSLCEWDKHQRVLEGSGRPKQVFIPPHLRQV